MVVVRRCQVCERPLEGKHAQRVCSGKCRAKLSRQARLQRQVERDSQVRLHLKAALEMLE